MLPYGPLSRLLLLQYPIRPGMLSCYATNDSELLMLRELNHRDHESGKTRWFADEYIDLFVWYQADRIIGFQLCYDKPGTERAITWKDDGSCLHTSIDSGEQAFAFDMTAVLVNAAASQRNTVIQDFVARSQNIDGLLVEFIVECIESCCVDRKV